MGQKNGRYECEEEKNFGFDFSFSNISCIFASSDICFGEYGLISAFVIHILFIHLISIPL